MIQMRQTRRRFLSALSSASVAGLIPASHSFAAEPPPETTTVRFPKFSNTICGAPVYVVEELLRAEGFTDVRYVPTLSGATGIRLAARGEVDIENAFVGAQVALIDAGERTTIPQHPGFEGQDGGPSTLGFKPAHAREQHGFLCRPRSRQGD
jgi:NitT/TauT family transport system substrate-binding protein